MWYSLIVIYNNVIMNVGYLYDIMLGIFIVFFEGIYVFYFYVLSYVDKVSYIMKVYY